MFLVRRAWRLPVLFLLACLMSLGSLLAVPLAASAADGSITRTITGAQPTYMHMDDPCRSGSRTTHYRAIQARIVGTRASVLTASVSPSGFRANLGVYDGSFMPELPIVNCMGNPSGGSTGAEVTYSIPTPSLAEFPGITYRDYVFVVAGDSAADLGAFTLSVTSSNATAVELTDITDLTPPVVTTPANQTVEATTAAGADVTFTASAIDGLDGTRPTTCLPASGSTFPIGRTRVTCTASDLSDNIGTKSFNITVQDKTAPAVTVPADLVVPATSSSGAVVTFAPSATDLVDPAPVVACAPASGSTFAIGVTTVSCTATDAARNASAPTTFAVTVSRRAMSSTGSVSVAGDPQVGKTLSATSTVATDPASSDQAGHWLRNGAEIASATHPTYVLTGEDLGATVTYRQTDTLDGYADVISTSNGVGPVEPGEIILATPVIDGTAKVGAGLSVEAVSVAPDDAAVTYEWRSGDQTLGAGTSYTVKPGDLGRTIEVTATALRADYATTSTTSATTAAVVRGDLAATGRVTISGTAKVDQVLSAESSVATVPSSEPATYQWFRGSAEIENATASSYRLTNADASYEISVVETRAKDGYVSVVTRSEATSKVTGGVLSLAQPTIAGNAVVDQELMAVLSTVEPSDATIAWRWEVDGQVAGTTATYVVKPADVDKTITVTATATREFFDRAVATSEPTGPVAAATFSPGPAASISGVLRIGAKLTAIEGTVLPRPGAFRYEWLANGVPIERATAKTFVLTPAQLNATISVRVTAVRPGYLDASSTSTSTAAVVPLGAPQLSLKASKTSLRLGGSTTLSWNSLDAITVQASGGWTGFKPSSGSQSIRPRSAGTATFILRASNAKGTTTAQIAVPVALPAKTLPVSAKSKVAARAKLRVRAWSLARGEQYTIRIGGVVVAKGKAQGSGQVDRTVRVPASVVGSARVLRVTGSVSDRTGSQRVKVVR